MEAFKRRPDLAIEALWSFMRSVFDPDFMEAYQQVWTTFADMSRDPTVEVGELVQEADFVLTATNRADQPTLERRCTEFQAAACCDERHLSR
jgi:hypothetical protein